MGFVLSIVYLVGPWMTPYFIGVIHWIIGPAGSCSLLPWQTRCPGDRGNDNCRAEHERYRVVALRGRGYRSFSVGLPCNRGRHLVVRSRMFDFGPGEDVGSRDDAQMISISSIVIYFDLDYEGG